jgi:hypothetical protein
MLKLQDQELTANHLNIVFDAIIPSRVTGFSVCALSGLFLIELIARFDAFFDESSNMEFLNVLYNFS